MYKAIKRHPTVLQLYEEKLINSGIISNEDVRTFKKTYRSAIEKGKSVTFNLAPRSNEDQWFDWNPYLDKKWYEHVETKLSHKTILSLTKQITSVPENFQLQKKVKKIFSDRQQMAKGDLPINWGFGEMIAYASLLEENFPIRFTGQDIRRGTFDHRHAVIFDQNDGEGYLSLNSIADKSNTRVEIYDSLLSEEAVLGFEYGYSATWAFWISHLGSTIW